MKREKRLIALVCLVHLVCFVHLVGLVQPNTRDRPDTQERPAGPRALRVTHPIGAELVVEAGPADLEELGGPCTIAPCLLERL